MQRYSPRASDLQVSVVQRAYLRRTCRRQWYSAMTIDTQVPVVQRVDLRPDSAPLSGPVVVAEDQTTLIVPPGWLLVVGPVRMPTHMSVGTFVPHAETRARPRGIAINFLSSHVCAPAAALAVAPTVRDCCNWPLH